MGDYFGDCYRPIGLTIVKGDARSLDYSYHRLLAFVRAALKSGFSD